MARTHAQVRFDIWADDDWRDLTCGAQWLYLHLISSPALSFCGVTDWRPARIAALAADLRTDDVELFAAHLEVGEFVVIDRDSEECLIRSWVKHDGLLKSPNMAKALVKAHAAVGSSVIRAVIVDQLCSLKKAQPKMLGWSDAAQVLAKRSMTVAEAFAALPRNPYADLLGNPSLNPSGNPSTNPSRDPSGNPSPTPFSVLRSPNSPPPNKSSSLVSTSPEVDAAWAEA